jgi:hypothetical protein
MMHWMAWTIETVIFVFLAWGGVLSLKCLLRDQTWHTPGRELGDG